MSVDVPWKAAPVDGRNYNWLGLAAAADLLFVMSYDERSQVWPSDGTTTTKCYAGANSPLQQSIEGVLSYVELGISPEKLIWGVPWYGYDYTCLARAADGNAEFIQSRGGDLVQGCEIETVPFRGAPCSDAAGRQLPITAVLAILESGLNTTHVQLDSASMSKAFSYVTDSGELHQIWFDDDETLAFKYAASEAMNLGGVGMWNIDCLGYDDTDDPRVAALNARMIDALPSRPRRAMPTNVKK